MKSACSLVVGAGQDRRPFRVEEMKAQAPLAWRAAGDAVYMVGTSASPVDRDEVGLAVRVRAGARLQVRSSAATLAWAGPGTSHTVEATVEAGGYLDWAPEPTITTGRCSHRQRATVHLCGDGALRWREMLVLGRSSEPTGALVSDLTVDLDGVTLIRHTLGVGSGFPGWDGPAVLGDNRVVGLQLVAGRAWAKVDAAAGPGWAVSPLEGPGVLAVGLGRTAAECAAALDRAAAHQTPYGQCQAPVGREPAR